MCNLIVSLMMGFITMTHPIHNSLSELDYYEDDKKFELSISVFLDDVEYCIKKSNSINDQIPIQANLESKIMNYLTNNFSVEVGGKKLQWKLVGSEMRKKHLEKWYYFESEKVENFDKFIIRNSMLFECYHQSNMLKISIDGQKLSTISLTKHHPKVLCERKNGIWQNRNL